MLQKELFRFPDKSLERALSLPSGIKIAVVPACNGAGASFISSLILFDKMKGLTLPEGQRSLIELGTPYFYNALGMEKRFEGRHFYDYSTDKGYQLNLEMGINWMLKLPANILIDENNIYRAISLAPGPVSVFDCSGIICGSLLENIIGEMDIVYLVIDPLPTKLLTSIANIEKIKAAVPECRLVLNKYNKGIHRGELNNFLEAKDYITIDAIDYYDFCKAEYNCVPVIR